MRTITRLLTLLRPFMGWVLLSILLGTAAVAAGIGLLGTSAFLIARAAQQPSIAYLQVAIVGVRFFGISRGVFRYLERLVSHSVNFRLLAQLRVYFYQALEPLAPARLQHYRSGDLLSRAVADIETLENFYVRAVAPPVIAFIVTSGVALFAGRYHLSLGLILSAGLLVGGVLLPLAARLASIRPGRAAVEQRAQLRAAVIDSIQGMPDLVSNGQAEHSSNSILNLSQALGRSQQSLAWVSGLSSGLMVVVSGLTLWLVLWTAIPFVNAGLFDGVALAVIALVTMASFEAVNPLGQAAQQLESSLQAARRLFALVDAEPEVRAPLQPCSPSPASDLQIRALSFRYLPDLPYILQNIDLDLPTGKCIALVGPSGAGKTTLANLLLRLWDYSEGEIRLGGCNLRQLDPQVVRQRFGVVSQRTYLFGGTLRDNLLLARPGVGEEQMWQALHRSGLASWVRGLPSQLDTWIGERGLQISAGERQRLAVARCILQDAPVLLLDEPTANLDAHTEEGVLATLNTLMKDRSVLWITHRLVGMETLDEIIVLDGGCIVQRGRHADLLTQPGLYQRMWTLQNRIIFHQ